jgi:hypothetical protein
VLYYGIGYHWLKHDNTLYQRTTKGPTTTNNQSNQNKLIYNKKKKERRNFQQNRFTIFGRLTNGKVSIATE